MFRFAVIVALLLCLPRVGRSSPPDKEINKEFDHYLRPVAGYIYEYYFEKIPADSLIIAGLEGLFHYLDPASEYDLGEDGKLSMDTFQKISASIYKNSLYPVSADTLVRFGIAGMIDILDPHSVFMEKRNLDNFNIRTRGHYGGLGFRIQVVYPDSAIAVWSLLHDQTPAAKAGVQSGDLIVAIGDSSTKKMSAADGADLMRGVPGTPVTLTLARAGKDQPFDITITREEVRMHSVPHYELFPDSTGYVKLARFQPTASDEVRHAIEDLQAKGMKRLIFDLQHNGGGYLPQAVAVADLFLDKGKLVVFHAGRASKDTTNLYTKHPALLRDEPLIVIVNQGAASASEIVAGAIQDWDRGLVLGAPTVGKGSVQQIIKIGDAELKLTTSAYFTPSGRSIDRRMRKDSTIVANSKREFRTRIRKRIVRSGGGITPDIPAETRRSTPIYGQLEGQMDGVHDLNNQFFYFARKYVAARPELTPEFRVDNDTLKEFRKFLEERQFDYISHAEARINSLEDIAKVDEYNKLEKSIKRLKNEIDKIEENHWDDTEELIRWKLTYEILEKGFGQRIASAYLVSVNPLVDKAREILGDPRVYDDWFRKEEIGALNEDEVADSVDSKP